MQFTLKRPTSNDHSAGSKPRSPLAGWLNFSKPSEPEIDLPEMDVTGALDRILKRADSTTPIQHFDVAIDSIREALAAIESSLFLIDQIREAIEQAFEIVLSANDVEEIGGRALLAESYDEIRESINEIIANSNDRAANLIGKNPQQIDVTLGGKAHYSITPMRLDTSERGLGLMPPKEAFATFDEITETLEQLDGGLKKADRAAGAYCKDAQYLISRMNKFS